MRSWLNVARLDFKLRLALVIAIEVAYMAYSRLFYQAGPDFTIIEILRTPARLVAAGAFCLLMPDIIFSRRPSLTKMRQPLFWLAMIFVAGSPILAPHSSPPILDAVILSVAAIPVGLHEEFFARGIVQNLIVDRLGAVWGVLLAAVIFALWHVGAAPDNAINFAGIAVAGIVFGVVYLKTGSIALVVALHAIYDSLFSFPAVFGEINPIFGLLSLMIGAAVVGIWAGRKTLPNLPVGR